MLLEVESCLYSTWALSARKIIVVDDRYYALHYFDVMQPHTMRFSLLEWLDDSGNYAGVSHPDGKPVTVKWLGGRWCLFDPRYILTNSFSVSF
jgi:hypothetical protein